MPLGSPAFRQAVIAVPLSLSLFTLAGLRYLFDSRWSYAPTGFFACMSPETRPRCWPERRASSSSGAWFPCRSLTHPCGNRRAGLPSGLHAALACLFASLILMELLLFSFEKIPFTSSYFPGKDPPVVTVIQYLLASALYVGVLSSLIRLALERPGPIVILLLLLVAGWVRARSARLGSRQIVRLEFEELAEPVVLLLGIERD